MDANSSREQKLKRQSVSKLLEAFYALWLRRFEEDNERFFEQVMRLADGKQVGSPQTVPAE